MKPLMSETEIENTVEDLADHVLDATSKPLVIHAIMNGAFMFAADFARQYDGKIKAIHFPVIRRGYSVFDVQEPVFLGASVPSNVYSSTPGCQHIVLDVIVEEGKTIDTYLKAFPPAVRKKIWVVCLIQKGTVNFDRSNETLETPDWFIGEQFRDCKFLTGYGMGPYRDFDSIYEISNAEARNMSRLSTIRKG